MKAFLTVRSRLLLRTSSHSLLKQQIESVQEEEEEEKDRDLVLHK